MGRDDHCYTYMYFPAKHTMYTVHCNTPRNEAQSIMKHLACSHLGSGGWVQHIFKCIKQQILPEVVIGHTLPVDVVLQSGDDPSLSITGWNGLTYR